MSLPKKSACFTLPLLLVFLAEGSAQNLSLRRGGNEFEALRPVSVPAGRNYAVVVVEFYHHGKIAPDGRNVAVASPREFVPTRILQLGPGDFCRLAFETVKGQSDYTVLYGGKSIAGPLPPWKNQDGLLLETRHYKNCNLRNFEAVRNAFENSKPYGSDYVETVMHAWNPFSLKREPFLSRYSGFLDIFKPGTYGFFTSSQDASFLLIDGKLVVAAPGRHPPVHRAFRGSRQDVKLSRGLHKFEYYHAAAGSEAVMAAAWEVEPTEEKPRAPMPLPSEVFHPESIGRLPVGPPRMTDAILVPDFDVKIAGEAPLPNNNQPLLGVSFRSVIPHALSAEGKITWDFGDGQTSNLRDADHVYLRPGLYTVKLIVRRSGRNYAIANRIEVDRPHLTFRDKQHTLEDYLQVIKGYDPHTLDAASLLQLVRAYEAEALTLESQIEDQQKKTETDPNRKPNGRITPLSSPGTVPFSRREKGIVPLMAKTASPRDLLADAVQYYWERAVETGRTAFGENSVAQGDADLLQLAEFVGPLARLKLGDAGSALAIWKGADAKIQSSALKAECKIQAADVLINDFARPAEAKPLLEAATTPLGRGKTGPVASALYRVWGDYYAATGDGDSARKSYAAAEKALGPARNFIERTAWQGAHSRSTEEYLRDKQFDRAAEELDSWLQEFPGGRIDGYLTLMSAKYWAGRQKYDAAIAQAEQLQTANPNSPYADQILFLAADCEMRSGRKDRALAALHAILTKYPGSPMVPLVKENIEILQKEGKSK
jgi:tetratricopeptide (TPR) repeat protein